MTPELIPLGAAFVVVSGFLARLLFFTANARILRALRRVRAVPIRDARDGSVVKIVGTVRYGKGSVQSTLTDRTCAYYSVLVDNPARWPAHEVVSEAGGVDFYVADATGVALVKIGDLPPATALVTDREYTTSPVDSDAVIERFMKARGEPTRGIVLLRTLRAREAIVVEGARVAVCGLARWMADPEAVGGTYREMAKRLVVRAEASVELYVSNHEDAL